MLQRQVTMGATRAVERKQARVHTAGGRLHALSPLATLGRGFGVARGEDGAARSRASQFAVGDRFDLQLRDGVVGAHVEQVRVGEQPRDA
jgi:exodeoxyribonuclease VII large subunit